MGAIPNEQAIGRVRQWVDQQWTLKRQNPRHRVLVDACMETMHQLSVREMVERTHGALAKDLLGYPREIARIDTGKIMAAILADQNGPVGGAGGLGIVEETICWTAVTHGPNNNFGLAHFSLLPTQRRTQFFDGNRQKVTAVQTDPFKSANYTYLGELVGIPFGGKEMPVQAFLFRGFNRGDAFLPDFRYRLPGITDSMYPKHDSQEGCDQMHVLGAAGFKLAQHFGLLGVDEPLADLVIGHDGHTAFFKFNLFLYFMEKFKDREQAILATRKLCAATIHAPQTSTVPITNGGMVRRHYGEVADKEYGVLGLQHNRWTSSLFADINMSGAAGVVSPIHLQVTEAEEVASARAFHRDAASLLPENVRPDQLKLFSDAVDMNEWLGIGTLLVLDKYAPGWRENPAILGEDNLSDSLRVNPDFRRDLADAFSSQWTNLYNLLGNNFPRQFGVEIPKNAIVFASLRRATAYKIGLITAFLENYQIFDKIAQSLNRPIFWLFGGVAHPADTPSIDSLANLLELISTVNKNSRKFSADFLVNYDIAKSKWIFPGLAERGCWVGCTNSIEHRSQGSEAFGPSYIKALSNGLHVLGPDDGGAGTLSGLPTVYVYGPKMRLPTHSFHNDLWGHAGIRSLSRNLLANGFLGGFNHIAEAISHDLRRVEAGTGSLAPGLNDRIYSMFQTIAGYNGLTLLNSYLSLVRS